MKRSKKGTGWNFFAVIGAEGSNKFLSAPILLNMSQNRTAFSVQANGENVSSTARSFVSIANEFCLQIPLAVSILEHRNQYFVTAYDDRCPFIEIDNKTSIDVFVAEADFTEFSKGVRPKRSIHDQSFQWLHSVRASSCLSYTPPSINDNFPEKQHSNVHLLFGCANRESDSSKSVSKLIPKFVVSISDHRPESNIQWSIPIEVDKEAEKYLALPFYGDIKMNLTRVNKTVKVSLQHIDFKKEFNVKVVHSKLSSPTDCPDAEPHNPPLRSSPEKGKTAISAVSKVKRSSFKGFCADVFVEEAMVSLYEESKDVVHRKSEIASIFLDEIFVSFSEERRSLEIGLGNIQVDNQLYSMGKYDFPVILCGEHSEKYSNLRWNDEMGEVCAADANHYGIFIKPTPFALHLLKPLLLANPLAYIQIGLDSHELSPKEVVCQIQPLRVYVEDKFISVLLDFAIENLPSNIIYVSPNVASGKRMTCQPGEVVMPRFVTDQVLSFFSEPLRLDYICIKPLSVLLSVHTCMRMYIALDHSPLHFAQFENRSVYTTTMRFGYNIGMHYVSDAIFGAGWVVGSLEILGSPSGLARSVSTGLWDFISMPVQGLMRGPWGVLLGITYGSASLIKNVTAGTVNSVTKLAASVARNLDRLTLDEEHLERTEALRRARPLGITHGLTQGLTGFGINLLGAVGGIARHTLEAKTSVGVIAGLGKGLLGVVTKPISGAAEFLALTGQGVLHTVGFNTLPSPRHFKSISNLTSNNLTLTKATWKFLAKVNYIDRVLATAQGTLIENHETAESVIVALTTEVIMLISAETNDLVKLIVIANIRAELGARTPFALILSAKTEDDSQQVRYNQLFVELFFEFVFFFFCSTKTNGSFSIYRKPTKRPTTSRRTSTRRTS